MLAGVEAKEVLKFNQVSGHANCLGATEGNDFNFNKIVNVDNIVQFWLISSILLLLWLNRGSVERVESEVWNFS